MNYNFIKHFVNIDETSIKYLIIKIKAQEVNINKHKNNY